MIFLFMLLFRVRATYYPWILLLMHYLSEWDIIEIIFGFIAGHLYYFLEDVLPRAPSFKNVKVLSTPYWLYGVVYKNSIKFFSILGLDCSEDLKAKERELMGGEENENARVRQPAQGQGEEEVQDLNLNP